MAELESSYFYLASSQASSNVNGAIITFNNFNIKECLGDLYDKYDKFKIVLTSIFNTVPTGVQFRNMGVKMTGLDWCGSYDLGTKDKLTSTLGLYICSTNNSTTQSILPSNWGSVFNKPSNPTINITLYQYDILTNSILTNISYGQTIYFFNIYGVK